MWLTDRLIQNPFRIFILFSGVAHVAHAQETVPFVVIVDDGTVEDTPFNSSENVTAVIQFMVDAYLASGAETPEVLSVWTAFPFNGNEIETRFLPLANDVTGIGLESVYGEEETFDSQLPPLRSVLIHNNYLALADRAAFEDYPTEGFANYVFLLELSHMWGPAAQLAAPSPARLIGFDFHWSFFMDAGGSPAGGNIWLDNEDGTFTTQRFDPGQVMFSPIDLYLMGLVVPDEVPPLGLLTDVFLLSNSTDPFTGTPIAAASFPWGDEDPVVVEATREVITIDDIIDANGTRVPAVGMSPTSWTLGILLILPQGTPEGEAQHVLTRGFVDVASDLAPAFSRATGGRGTLEVVTSSPQPPPPPVDEEGNGDEGDASGSCKGCTQADAGGAAAALLALLLSTTQRRRTRSRKIAE